jgi:peptidoglycan LD-endopeptidase CwlK
MSTRQYLRRRFDPPPVETLHHLPEHEALALNPAYPHLEQRAMLRNQMLLTLRHVGFDGQEHLGQLVVHRDVAGKVQRIFAELCRARFPIALMVPAVAFRWDDTASMRANNTSGFNYRFIAGTERLSRHAAGQAIDINPWQNPHIIAGTPLPAGAGYDPTQPGTITADALVVELFCSAGARWGGEWQDPDYQHFEFP